LHEDSDYYENKAILKKVEIKEKDVDVEEEKEREDDDEEEEETIEINEIRKIKLSNIYFSYFPENEYFPPALDINGKITFKGGKHYAIVGQNRSGKSTLCKLLTKLYQPQYGTITVNGINYDKISRISLRKRISYVSQQPFLFPGTIRDNIKVGNPNATEEEIFEAAQAAGVFAYGFEDNKVEENPASSSLGMRRSLSMIDMRLKNFNGADDENNSDDEDENKKSKFKKIFQLIWEAETDYYGTKNIKQMKKRNNNKKRKRRGKILLRLLHLRVFFLIPQRILHCVPQIDCTLPRILVTKINKI